MTFFTVGPIRSLRAFRAVKLPMRTLIVMFPQFTRDELVEGLDATVRCETDHSAMAWANHAISCRQAGIPLINGRPSDQVLKRRTQAMF